MISTTTTGGSGHDDDLQHMLSLTEGEMEALSAAGRDVGSTMQTELGARLERALKKIDDRLGELAIKRMKKQLEEL